MMRWGMSSKPPAQRVPHLANHYQFQASYMAARRLKSRLRAQSLDLESGLSEKWPFCLLDLFRTHQMAGEMLLESDEMGVSERAVCYDFGFMKSGEYLVCTECGEN